MYVIVLIVFIFLFSLRKLSLPRAGKIVSWMVFLRFLMICLPQYHPQFIWNWFCLCCEVEFHFLLFFLFMETNYSQTICLMVYFFPTDLQYLLTRISEFYICMDLFRTSLLCTRVFIYWTAITFLNYHSVIIHFDIW